MDYTKFKVNASQVGSLIGHSLALKPVSEPQLKKLYDTLGRDYEELSEKMKFDAKKIMTKAIYYDPKRPGGRILSEFVMIYAYEMYGKGKVSKGNDSPMVLEKGNMGELSGIEFLSKIDGKSYQKNTVLHENQWFKGIPDIIVSDNDGVVDKIIDIKISFDLPSFIMTKMRSEEASNIYELMCYMDLLKCKSGEIVHILVDMPPGIVSMEEKRLKERYATLGLNETEATSRLQLYFNNVEYSNIPDELKYFRREYTLNKLTMKMVKSRVTRAKKWMSMVHESFTQNNLTLREVDDETEEDNI